MFTKKKTILALLVLVLLTGAIIFRNSNRLALVNHNNKDTEIKEGYGISFLIIHEEDKGSPLYQHLSQSWVVGTSAEEKTLQEALNTDLNKYDVVYINQSLKGNSKLKDTEKYMENYVADGGKLFLDMAVSNDFSKKLTGISDNKKIDINVTPLIYPEIGGDFEGIQKVAKAFEEDYKRYIKEELLVETGNPSGAETIIGYDGGAILSVNKYKKGQVFVISDFLPDYSKYITSFDFKHRGEENNYFQFFYATGNMQMLNELAAYVAKDNHGLAFKKVMGTYGRPAVAWQNHYEVLSSIKNKEFIRWIDILKEYDQVSSMSLVRGSYEWGEWYGTINYHINRGDNIEPIFVGEEEESYYSTGFHIKDSNGEYITFGKYPEYTSYYSPVENNFRPYPYFIDWDKDGKNDIIVGSHDGKVYFVKNTGTQKEAAYNKVITLLYEDGNPIAIGENIAPTVIDYNGDGLMDLIVGDREGNLYLLINGGKGFKKATALTTINGEKIKVKSEAAPFVGDFDGDGIIDLVVGDGDGYVHFYKGIKEGGRLGFNAGGKLNASGETIKVDRFAAPHIGDYNDDGVMDILVGDGSGDIHLYIAEKDSLVYKGPVASERKNIYGKNTIYTGKNVVPFLIDYNGDGKQDLVTAQMEFGLAYDTASEDFPYRKELLEILEYAEENYVDVMPHIHFHSHKDNGLEKREIELHKENFRKLGLPWGYTGTNQHTWRVNVDNPIQSFENLMRYNIWNDFAFRPPYAPTEPYIGKDYIWPVPFIMMKNSENLPMLLFSPVLFLGEYGTVCDHLVDMDLPLTFFEHIDYKITEGGESIQILYNIINKIEHIRKNNNYSFMTEKQMAKAFINSMLTEYKVDINSDEIVLTPDTSKVPEHLAEDYIGTGGLKIELGEKLNGKKVYTDSPIQYTAQNSLYIGVDRPIKLGIARNEQMPGIKIIAANTPIMYRKNNDGLIINLNGNGMKEIKLESSGVLNISGENLKIKQDGDIYTVIHYGDQVEIKIQLDVR